MTRRRNAEEMPATPKHPSPISNARAHASYGFPYRLAHLGFRMLALHATEGYFTHARLARAASEHLPCSRPIARRQRAFVWQNRGGGESKAHPPVDCAWETAEGRRPRALCCAVLCCAAEPAANWVAWTSSRALRLLGVVALLAREHILRDVSEQGSWRLGCVHRTVPPGRRT
jgi:hypothetical protein